MGSRGNNCGMDIELSALEERAGAREHMAEALRILNAAIRRIHREGLSGWVEVLTMCFREGALLGPILSSGGRKAFI
ncbi:Hypothetical protein NGAL_HAMBI1145_56930 [Neorhizobium galegae bv. officinalis]|uniref:Uncharacterized protein n=1 Tax=Neorhizobium galegae bv. officinalis TaxID=323656 RepID=A0A0T7G1B1_NEOGA|nr:Hypothetical protein NGAL_HAMBI1145_56930 [Neorhizobium galegae bv. officinalis]